MTSQPDVAAISVSRTLNGKDARAVLDMAKAAARSDGVSPLDDQVRLDLAHDAENAVSHLLARRDDDVIGYAHARATDTGLLSAHVVVAPDQRRQGTGTALVERLLALAGRHGLRVWAHGDEAAAELLSTRLGFARVRDLWQMSRRLDLPLAPPTYPDDVHVRTFEVGQDEDAWLRVNAEAFADHPEQGSLTEDDLRQRIEESWFDSLGFFLALRGSELLGFHWTKVHPATPTRPDPVGEVYAVGVARRAQGIGLGKALTATGLMHLRSLGLREVLLYVDGDNEAAIAVYEKLGFSRSGLDVMFEHT